MESPINRTVVHRTVTGTTADTGAGSVDVTLTEALSLFVEDYLWQKGYSVHTEKNYVWAVNSFIKACGDKQVNEITQEDIKKWRRWMETNDYTIGAVNSFLYRIRLLLRWCGHKEVLSIVPDDIVIPKKEKKLPKTLTRDQIITLLEKAKPREKAMILLMYSSGIRVGELCSLKRSDIVGTMMKVRGKGRKERLAFVDPEAQKALVSYLKTRKDTSPALFYSKKCNGLKVGSAMNTIKKLSRECGIPATCHVFRHTFATDMIREGCGAFHLQKMLGHEHISTTQMYVHLNDKDIHRAYAKYHKQLLTK